MANYFSALDGLRAISIALVIGLHCYPYRIPGGFAGVHVFFVLSGFLITRSICNERRKHDQFDIGHFYWRRILRLAPALYLTILASIIMKLWEGGDPTQHLKAALSAAFYVMNWSIALNNIPQADLGHTWSLAVEEQFYLIWPLAMLWIPPATLRKWLLPCILAIAGWRAYLALNGVSDVRIYFAFDTRCDALLAGCLLALVDLPKSIRRIATAGVIAPIVLIGSYAAVGTNSGIALAFVYPLIICSAAWLIVAATSSGWLEALLSLAPLRYVGRISYGLYLFHYPILHAASRYHQLARFEEVALMVVAFIAASLSYHYFEQPILKRGARKTRPAPTQLSHPHGAAATT